MGLCKKKKKTLLSLHILNTKSIIKRKKPIFLPDISR